MTFIRGLVSDVSGWAQQRADRVIGKVLWGYHKNKWWA